MKNGTHMQEERVMVTASFDLPLKVYQAYLVQAGGEARLGKVFADVLTSRVVQPPQHRKRHRLPDDL